MSKLQGLLPSQIDLRGPAGDVCGLSSHLKDYANTLVEPNQMYTLCKLSKLTSKCSPTLALTGRVDSETDQFEDIFIEKLCV